MNSYTRSIVAIVAVALLIQGCGSFGEKTHNLGKALEKRAYNELAQAFTDYCATFRGNGPYLDHLRIEMSREIRQSPYGAYGPEPPSNLSAARYINTNVSDGNKNTWYGSGPIVLVYCEGDTVPMEVWLSLDRYWED
jgi:hypothetical protein